MKSIESFPIKSAKYLFNVNVATVLIYVLFSIFIMTNATAVTCDIDDSPGEYGAAFEDSAGNQRFYLYKVPTNYDPLNLYPLVFVFHGAGQSALTFADIEGQVRMRELADQRDFILVYPQGNSHDSLSPPPCPPTDDYFQPAIWEGFTDIFDSRDILFVDELYAYLSASLNIDDSKVYAVGFSNGGMEAHWLGGERAEIFTAIAAVASTAGADVHITLPVPVGETSEINVTLAPPQPTRLPMPVLTIHSELDPVISFDGGYIGIFNYFSNSESWNHWYTANNCNISLNSINTFVLPNGISGRQVTNLCDTVYSTAPLEKIVFSNLGFPGSRGDHTWPNLNEHGYDASEVIIDFLFSFSK